MPTDNFESTAPETDADLTSAEAAEQAAAEAEARAEAARARADELRRKLNLARGESGPESDDDNTVTTKNEADDAEPVETGSLEDVIPPPRRPRRMRRPRLGTVAATVGVLVSLGFLTGTGYMLWQNHKVTAENQRSAQFSAAARQGVVNLMSMDYAAAKDSVQRVLDDSTGKFHNNLEDSADDLIKAMESSKVKTTVTVNDSAVESISGDTAVVLVTATSEKHDATQPPDAGTQPRVWRVMVTVMREGGQGDGAQSAGGVIKVSDIEFL
jgi:Mce-associated membrane protein